MKTASVDEKTAREREGERERERENREDGLERIPPSVTQYDVRTYVRTYVRTTIDTQISQQRIVGSSRRIIAKQKQNRKKTTIVCTLRIDRRVKKGERIVH